jgi:uncharacterized protein YraI
VPIRSLVVFFAAISFLGTGCDVQVRTEAIPATSPLPVTATLPATTTPLATETSLPPPPPPTVAPVEGVTSTQLNVRAEPSTAGSVLGIIPADTRVEIVGKDPGESWWQINYPQGQGTDGKGWVTAEYIITLATPDVPIIGGDRGDPNEGNVAVVQQQINVRSGPGTGFNSLGTLNPQDVVQLTGKDANGAWLQIGFAAGPEGKAWINAAFVQALGVENLPIITEAGVIVGTGTPTNIPPTPTATIVPARQDNDSPDNPLVNVIFDPIGTRTLIYNGDVSAPDGDTEDWIQFTSFSERIRIEVTCKGSDMRIELIQNGSTFDQAACAAQQIVSVKPDQPVQVHLEALSEGSLRYSSYTLKVTTFP